MLSVPEEPEKFRFEGLELAEIIREKELERIKLEEEQKELYEQRINRRPNGTVMNPGSRPAGQMDMPSGFRRDTTGRFPGQMERSGQFRRDTAARGDQQVRGMTER